MTLPWTMTDRELAALQSAARLQTLFPQHSDARRKLPLTAAMWSIHDHNLIAIKYTSSRNRDWPIARVLAPGWIVLGGQEAFEAMILLSRS